MVYRQVNSKDHNLNSMSQILIIYTGGTIGMISDPVTKVLKPINFEQIMDNVPELEKLNCKIKVHSFEQIIDSSNMNPAVWSELAGLIEANYNDVDGFVILHGSDTMAFSASAMSFLLEDLGKPVIFTGSQLPISAVRTDAKDNLMTAIEIAKAKKNDRARVPEVCIYFDYKLFRGNRAFKYNSSKFEAFRSPNYPILAESGVHLRFSVNDIRQPNDGVLLKVHRKLVPDVAVLKLYPGIGPKVVETVLSSDVRGIVMETFGAGNTTTDAWFIDLLKAAIQSGKVIFGYIPVQGRHRRTWPVRNQPPPKRHRRSQRVRHDLRIRGYQNDVPPGPTAGPLRS